MVGRLPVPARRSPTDSGVGSLPALGPQGKPNQGPAEAPGEKQAMAVFIASSNELHRATALAEGQDVALSTISK